MVFYGYLFIIASVALLIVLAEILLPRYINREYCRKLLHIGTFAVFPLARVFFRGESIHFVIVSAIFTLLTCVMYFGGLFKTVDAREKKYPGIFYYALALLITSGICYFLPSCEFFFGVGFIALAFGDGFATLIGVSIGRHKIYGAKTIEGFLACIVFTAIPLAIYNKLCGGMLSLWHILLLSLLCAVVELVDFGLDNLAIPLTTFLCAFLIAQSADAAVALVIALAVFSLAFFSRLIRYYGALLASLLGFLFYFYGGVGGIGFVVGCYAVMILVTFIGKWLKNDVSSVVKKTKGKDFIEILVNGVWSLIAMILFACTDAYAFYVMALISMSAGFVDSLASDIGTLSKRPPYDIFHKCTVTKGISGGITPLGTIASLLGALGFASAITLLCHLPLYAIPILFAISYAGCICDTALGALVQVKYRCTVCGADTEREEHCQEPTVRTRGIPALNNDTVNLLSGLLVFLLSFTVFIFI